MNNLRLTSILSVALLFSYSGNTICSDKRNSNQDGINFLVGFLTLVSLEAANQIIDEERPCYKHIHDTTKLARRNVFNQGFYGKNRLECLKSDDLDFFSGLEALVENGCSMGTLFVIKKTCESIGISKGIEDIGNKIMNSKVKTATVALSDFFVMYFGWNMLKRGINSFAK